MVARILAALLLAGLGLMAFTLVFIRTEKGGRDLCALAQATLEDVSHERVVIGHCSVDPIGTRVVIENIEIGPPDRQLFAADRLAAGIDHSGLFAGKVRVDGVEVVRPRVRADLSLPTKEKTPKRKRPAGAACLPDIGRLQIGRISVTQGSLNLLLPGERGLALQDFNVAIQGKGDQLTIDLDTKKSVLADAEGATTATITRIRGLFDFDGGKARLDEVEVKAPELWVRAHGELTSICSFQGSAEAMVNLDFARLHDHLLSRVPNLAGTAEMKAQVKLDGENFDATLTADVRNSEVLEMEPGDFSIQARATPTELTVASIKLPMEGGALEANGKLGLAAPFPLEASLLVDGFQLGELLERLGAPGLPVHLAADGKAQIAGELVGEEGLQLTGSADLKVAEFGVFDRSWRHRQKGVRFVGFPRGLFKGDFTITSKELLLKNARFENKTTLLDVNGLIGFDTAKGMSLRFMAPRMSLGDLGPFATTVCLGQGSAKGTVRGPYTGLVIQGDTSVRGLSVIGYELGDVTGSILLDLQEKFLRASNVSGTKGESVFHGGGVLDFQHGVSLDARLGLDGARTDDLLSIAEAKHSVLTPLKKSIHATLTGDVEVHGPAATPTVTTQVQLAAVNLYGQRFDSGTLRAELPEAKSLDISSIELRRGQGRIVGSTQLHFSDGAFKLNVLSEKLVATDIDAIAKSMPKLDGGISLSLKGSGTLAKPDVKGRLTLNEWFLDEQPLATARLYLHLDGTTLTADGSLASPFPLGTPVPEHRKGTAFAKPARSMWHVLNARVELHDDWPFELEGTFDIPDFTMLLKPGAVAGLSAGLDGSLHATGALLHPWTSEAVLSLEKLWVQRGRTKLENGQPVRATFANGVFSLDQFPVRGSSFEMEAYGSFRPTVQQDHEHATIGGPANLIILGHLNLEILRQLVPDLEEAEGDLRVNLELASDNVNPPSPMSPDGTPVSGGVLDIANLTGSANLTDVSLSLHNFPMRLTSGIGSLSCNFPVKRDANGVLKIADGKVRIEDLSAKLNEGSASIAGEVRLDDRSILEASVSTRFEDVSFRLDDLPMTISGEPVFIRKRAGDFEPSSAIAQGVAPETFLNVLGGNIKVVRLRYQKDLELERAIVNAVDFSRRPPQPKVFEKQGDFLKLDMGISLGDVQVRNNLLKAQFDGNLKLTGSIRRPGVLGTVSFTEGKATIRNVEYTVTSGVVNFVDRSGIRPTFDVRADAHVSHAQTEYNIHATATGTPQQPKLLLSSEPVLSDADILTLLTIGVINSDLERTSSASASLGGVLADAAYNASGLSDQMKRLLPKNDILRDAQFRVSSDYNELNGNIEPVALIETKILKDSWKLRGQTSLLGSRGRKAQIQVRLKDSMDAQGQWDGDKPSAPSYGDFGGDLRLHWEAP